MGIDIKKFREEGFRLTPQRLAILEFLDGNTSHPTAEDILTEVRKTHPTVSMATVYNTLDVLKRGGRLLEITIDPRRSHFDPNPEPHQHIICVTCGRIDDLFIDSLKGIELPEDAASDFELIETHVNFYGRCRDCCGPGG
ncbi:MAG TPA: transcriptional repressor [Deltaproteobacteria bacterium]|nr:transcriptional repressor [Deltaproteobacteria bacterium]